MKERNPYLLPTEVEPHHYEIEWKPNFSDFTFAGSERIDVTIRKPVTKITLHALDLKIQKAQVRVKARGGGLSEPLDARRIRASSRKESVTLEFGKQLPRGPAELLFEFQGELNDKMHGFYRTSYLVDGERRWGAATQFEATDARRAFPCWDEPARKATFGVTLTVPEHMTSLSNMPVSSETSSEPGWKTVCYEKTPVMSTYLVAMVVAELDYLEDKDRNGVPIRVYTSPGKREQGRFALGHACHTLAYFADWFGIPYAFPKLDMVALPDFAAGAMENWGLVTYRETALLVDEQHSAESARQRVAEVVDHELAHQWFGNYTTMNWWTDLWLNEGFASYMGPKATNHRFPEWDTWTQFVADEFLSALHQDSLRSTHPVEVPVKNPHEIREVFDAISYSKGSVVNRMAEHFLGETDFRNGLHNYLRQHAFANAGTDDLWKALEKESGKPVRAIMKAYTKQSGYPVIVAREKPSKGALTLELEQSRFLADGGRDPKKMLWQIPLGIWTEGAAEPTFKYMKGRRLRARIPANDGEWVKLNPGQSGLYRVAYSEELWRRLTGAVRDGALPTVDRLGLIDDAFALARAGYVKTSEALGVLDAYQAETDFSVWLTIAGILDSLDNLVSRERCREKFREAARQLLTPIAKRQGWEKRPSDGHLDVLLRSLALRNAGAYGDQATIDEARTRFASFCRSGELDPNLRLAVYSLAAENGGPAEWEELQKLYHATDLHEEKIRVLRAAGSFRQPELIEQVLRFAISDQVRSQDTPIVLANAAGNPAGRALAWRFLKKNWKMFVQRYHGGGLGLLSRLIGIPSGFTERRRLESAQKFFRAHKVPGTERAVRKTLEFARGNVKWLERDRKDLRAYFA